MHSAPSGQDGAGKRRGAKGLSSDGLSLIQSGRNESLMSDVNERMRLTNGVEAEALTEAQMQLRASDEASCVESRFKLYVPQRLGAMSNSGANRDSLDPEDDDDLENSLGYRTRRDDALISSPRSLDSGLGGGDITEELGGGSKKSSDKRGLGSSLTSQELEANARRQAQFLERTEAGRKLLREYTERAQRDENESMGGRNSSMRQYDDAASSSGHHRPNSRTGSAKKAAAAQGSFFFKYTGRKDPALKTDAPPTGRYNPRFHLIEGRVRTLSMKKAYNPRARDAQNAPQRLSSSLRPNTSPHISMTKSPLNKSVNKRRSSFNSTTLSAVHSTASTPRKTLSSKKTPSQSSGKKKNRNFSSTKKRNTQKTSAAKSPAPPMAIGAGALQAFADDESMDGSVDTETREKRKQLKRYQDQVSRWIQSRFQTPPAEGLSSMRSSSEQRGGGGEPILHDLSYWPQSDASRFMPKSVAITDMKRETGRDHVKKSVYDPVYNPNHDIRYTRTTIGMHNMNGHCDRDSQMRTSRIAVKTSSGARSKTDVAMDKFYDTDQAREKLTYKREQSQVVIDKIVGREDPRNNYLLQTQQKALKSRGTVLGGLEPDHLLSQRNNTIKKIEFSKQIGRKFNPGFVMHDLSYEPDHDAVSPNRAKIVPFERETERAFNPGFVMHDLTYNVKLDSASKSLKAPAPVDMKRDTTRANNVNAMLSRTTSENKNDVEYEKAPEQHIQLQQRVKGNPFMRNQLGRSELERLSRRQRAAPDIFYNVAPAVYDKVQNRQIRFSSVHMDKVTNRYEKFENTMSRSGMQAQRGGSKGVEQPFVVRGQGGIVLNDLTYDAKFDIISDTPITHTFPKTGRR